MMKCLFTLLVLCVGLVSSADAQTFTQRIQKKTAGQGTVTIHHDSAIDRLVNLSTSASTTPSAPSAPATVPSTPKPSTATTTASNSTPDASKPAARTGGHQVVGYRVQAYAGGNSRKDRQRAEQIGNNIRSNFAGVPVYVHFYSPRWICRVGNYRTYEEAHQMLTSLRNMGYTEASIVKGKITVQY